MRRPLIYTLILLFLLGHVPVDAQSNMLGLSDADYALLRQANSGDFVPFSFSFNTHLSVEGLDTFALSADLSGSGNVDLTHSLLAAVKGRTTLGTMQSAPVNTEVRLIDDTLYLNLGNGWQSINSASTFLAKAIGQYLGLTTDPAIMKMIGAPGIEGSRDVLTALMKIEPQSFLSVKRLADDIVNNSKMAHFQLTANVQALMQTDAFVDVVAAFAAAQGNDLVILDYAELAKIVRANSALFKGTTLTIDQYIGLDESVVYRHALKLEMPIDPSVGGYSDAPFRVKLVLDMTITGWLPKGCCELIDISRTLSTPEGAKTVTAFEFPTPQPLQAPSDGLTQYVFFETVGESEPFTQAFEAKAGDTVTITVRGLGLEFDSSAKLLSLEGETLAEDDDHETNAFGLGYPDPQIADFKITQDGAYQVEVQEINGVAGSFVLTIGVRR